MKKANPTIVGRMRCDCGEVMEVRERSNGRKLLYTYCPVCKQDMRSGEQLQQFWRDNMTPVGQPLQEVTKAAETSTQAALPAPKPELPTETTEGEWIPADYTESKPNETESENSIAGLLIGGFVALTLFAFGIRARGNAA